jgi:hypothetical protein
MKHEDELSPFEQRARDLLQDSTRNLDGATRMRLAQARAAATSQLDARPGWFSFRYLAPAGAMAAVVLVAMLFMAPKDAGVNDPAGNALYDLELLADADAFELSQEADLEFIEWAASMGEQGKAGS